ncbi:MAG: S1/P1 nuclease [Myxococcota bacterium]
MSGLVTLRVALLLGLGLVASPAMAWDLEGHQAVAAMAEAQLSPAAKKALAPLTGGLPLADRLICFWPDDIKQERPATRPWHWVNIPKEAPALDPARDCPEGACVTQQISAQLLRLADPTRAISERREALSFVVHLIADVHQPLHVGDAKDRGGNRIQVRLVKTSTDVDDLHWVWDGPLVKTALRHQEPLQPAEAGPLGPASPEAWANESHRLVQTIYSEVQGPMPVNLAPNYLPAHAPLVRRQLARAALRLARALETALQPQRPATRAAP